MFKKNQPSTQPITDEAISLRAYELWQARGCPKSDGHEDWQAAHSQLVAESERENRRQPLRKLFARMRQRAA